MDVMPTRLREAADTSDGALAAQWPHCPSVQEPHVRKSVVGVFVAQPDAALQVVVIWTWSVLRVS